jgi:hypothetical protein
MLSPRLLTRLLVCCCVICNSTSEHFIWMTLKPSLNVSCNPVRIVALLPCLHRLKEPFLFRKYPKVVDDMFYLTFYHASDAWHTVEFLQVSDDFILPQIKCRIEKHSSKFQSVRRNCAGICAFTARARFFLLYPLERLSSNIPVHFYGLLKFRLHRAVELWCKTILNCAWHKRRVI